jgi:hypothetical protein
MTALADAFDRLHDPDEWDTRLLEHLQTLKQQYGEVAVEVDGNVSVDRCTVYAGSLHVRGDFVFSSHVLVLGDLQVDGVVVGEPEHAILMVVGDLSAQAMAFLRSYLCITGNMACRAFLLGTCDGFARVAGTVTTPLLLQEHWEHTSFDEAEAGQVDARFWCDIRSAGYRAAYPRPQCTSEPAAALSEEVLRACSDEADDDNFDPWKLLAFVQGGGSLM